MAIIVGPTQWQDNVRISGGPLGSAVAGGYIICRSGGVAWIVSPYSTEVTRSWNSLNDAVTTAQASAACGDWFVPTLSQLQNPGYVCRTYWDSYSSARYWSSTGRDSTTAYGLDFSNGGGFYSIKSDACCVRAFRCVTY